MFQSSFLFNLFERKEEAEQSGRVSLLTDRHPYSTLPYLRIEDDSEQEITDDDKLCNDVLMHIFSFLDPKDLVVVSRVDNRWRSLSQHDFVWNNRNDIFVHSNNDYNNQTEDEGSILSRNVDMRTYYLEQMKYFSYIFRTNNWIKRIRFLSFVSLHLFFVGLFVSIVTLSFLFRYDEGVLGPKSLENESLIDDTKWYNWFLCFLPGFLIMYPFIFLFFLCNIYETDFMLLKRQEVLLRAKERGFIGYEDKKFYGFEINGNIVSLMNLVQIVMCVFLVYGGILFSFVLNGSFMSQFSNTAGFMIPAIICMFLYGSYLLFVKARQAQASLKAVAVYFMIYLYFTTPVLALLFLMGLKMDDVINLHTQSFFTVFFVFSGIMCAGIMYMLQVLVKSLMNRLGIIMSVLVASCVIMMPVFLLLVTYLLFQLEFMGVVPKVLVLTFVPFWSFVAVVIGLVLCTLDICQYELYCRD